MKLEVFVLLTLTSWSGQVLAANSTKAKQTYATPAAFVSAVNRRAAFWKAADHGIPLHQLHTGVDMEESMASRLPKAIPVHSEDVELPENFDARTKWTECRSLREVRHQGCCSSCYAVSAVEAMTDRYCIHSDAKRQFSFGAYDVVACCQECGNGCQGGKLGPTWEYWVTHGISSGGPFGSHQGCHSYPVDVCRNDDDAWENEPRCYRKCQAGYNVTTSVLDRKQGRVAYSLPNDEEMIRMEIHANGPVQAAFVVFTDFKLYKSGIYRYSGHGKVEGSHAVRVLGWGVEDGVRYWLAANCWGTEWGDKGYFKIVRGENHMGFESMVHAGLPSYSDRYAGTENKVQ